MKNKIQKHFDEVKERAEILNNDLTLNKISNDFMSRSHLLKYSYNFTWLGRPIIQYPQDILSFQEIVFKVNPDLIIETGIAHGGSLILSASLLNLLDLMQGINPKQSNRKVIGIDIDIRSHNYESIKNHPFSNKINMIEGSSIDKDTIKKVMELKSGYKKVLVCLDSNHTHDHVKKELCLYSEFVSLGSYIIVFDTVIEDLPKECCNDRPWSIGNNPLTAVNEWIDKNKNFKVDKFYDKKSLISVAKGGFLERIK